MDDCVSVAQLLSISMDWITNLQWTNISYINRMMQHGRLFYFAHAALPSCDLIPTWGGVSWGEQLTYSSCCCVVQNQFHFWHLVCLFKTLTRLNVFVFLSLSLSACLNVPYFIYWKCWKDCLPMIPCPPGNTKPDILSLIPLKIKAAS